MQRMKGLRRISKDGAVQINSGGACIALRNEDFFASEGFGGEILFLPFSF